MNQHIHKILLSLRDLLSPPACCCLDAEDLEKDESLELQDRAWCGNGAPGKDRMGIAHQRWLLEGKTRQRWEEVSVAALVAGLGSNEATGRGLRRGSWGAGESGMLGRGSGVTAQQHSPATARLKGSSPWTVWEQKMLVVPVPGAGTRTAVPCSTHRTHLGHSQHSPLLLVQEFMWATMWSNTEQSRALTPSHGSSTETGAATLPAGRLQEGHKQGMDKLIWGHFLLQAFENHF